MTRVGVTQEKKPPTGPSSCYSGSFLLGVSFFSTSSCSLTHVESFRWESAGEERWSRAVFPCSLASCPLSLSDITLPLGCLRVTFMYQFVCDGQVSQCVCVEEDNLEDSVLSFPHVGSSGLVGLYPRSHLASLASLFLLITEVLGELRV